MIPVELQYTESHEWIRKENNTVTVGITHFAQEQLTDIVFVELPEINQEVVKGSECAVVESCKIAAEIYSPVSGKVAAINERLADQPETVNQDPYGEGWLLKIELSNPGEMESLLSAESYKSHIETSA